MTFAIHLYPIKMIESTTIYRFAPKGGSEGTFGTLSYITIRKQIIRSIHSSPFLFKSRAGGAYGIVSLSTALRQSQQNQRFNESELVIKRLLKIEGLGRSTIARYLNYMGLTPSIRIRDLTKYQENRLYDDLDKWLKSCNLLIGSAHREAKSSQLQKLRSIQSYRGLRNAKGLPARGQNTKGNGRTKRKLRIK